VRSAEVRELIVRMDRVGTRFESYLGVDRERVEAWGDGVRIAPRRQIQLRWLRSFTDALEHACRATVPECGHDFEPTLGVVIRVVGKKGTPKLAAEMKSLLIDHIEPCPSCDQRERIFTQYFGQLGSIPASTPVAVEMGMLVGGVFGLVVFMVVSSAVIVDTEATPLLRWIWSAVAASLGAMLGRVWMRWYYQL